MKDCVLIQEKLVEFILKELDDHDAREVQRHLTECNSCRSQLIELEQLYSFGDRVFSDWKNSAVLSPQIAAKLEEGIMSVKPFPFWRSVPFRSAAAFIVVLTLFLGTYISPTAAYYGSKIPFLGRVFSVVDEGALIAHEEGFGQRVAKSSSINGFTLVVDEVIVDKTRTVVFYRIKVPEEYEYKGGSAQDIVLEDQLHVPYQFSAGAAEWSPETNEVLGTAEFQPLKSWARKLTFRTTALGMWQDGRTSYHFGGWSIKFDVDPFLADKVTKEISLNKPMSVPGGEVVFTKAVLAPSQTTFLYKYKASEARSGKPVFSNGLLRNVRLIDGAGGQFSGMGGREGTNWGSGQGEIRFGSAVFGGCDKIVLKGDGFSVYADQLHVRIPLKLGDAYPHQAVFQDGKITIEDASLASGKIFVRILTGVDKVNTIISAHLEAAGKKYQPIGIDEIDKKVVERAALTSTALVQELIFPAAADGGNDLTLVVEAAVVNIDQPWEVEIPLQQGGTK